MSKLKMQLQPVTRRMAETSRKAQEPRFTECPRVAARMACEECGYPFCEAMSDWDGITPHVKTT